MSKFFFAWVDNDETEFDPVAHARWDENVLSFDINHEENDFPTLGIDIKNPRVGLLAPGRKVWAWLGYEPNAGGPARPIFFGRMVGIPTNIIAEVCTLTFVARPLDYMLQKLAIANALKVAPYYDPIFLSDEARDDPDAILEAYPRLWHIDRTTLEVTTSDIITGEDGTEVFAATEAFYDSLSITLQQTPLVAIDVIGSVGWSQTASGAVEINTGGAIKALNGAQIISDWPKPGTSLGGGWEAASSSALDVLGTGDAELYSGELQWQNDAREHANGDQLSISASFSSPLAHMEYVKDIASVTGETGSLNPFSDPPINTPATLQTSLAFHMIWTVATTLSVAYAADRKRSERVLFTMTSDFQNILTEVEDGANRETLTLNAEDIGALIGEEVPIGDPSRRSFFPTERGTAALEYLINVARTRLLFRARAVHVSWECPAERALSLSLRKNAIISDGRLPGGVATGKIVSYSLSGDGDSGLIIGKVTIGASIGAGGAVAAVPGNPSYVEDGYAEDGYQFREGATISLGDIGYSPIPDTGDDDGLRFPLDRHQVVLAEGWQGSLVSQQAAIAEFLNSPRDPGQNDGTQSGFESLNEEFTGKVLSVADAVKANPVYFELQLLNLNARAFASDYNVTVSPLVAPKQIDLEALAS